MKSQISISVMKIIKLYILLLVTLLLPLSSCVDDDLFIDNKTVAEGETEITASLSFPSFSPALHQSRAVGGAPGTAISDIETLYILIYAPEEGTDDKGNTTTVWKLEENGRILVTSADHSLQVTNPDADRVDKDAQEETETAHATFRLKHKNGTYKIYAVANVDLSPEAVRDDDIDTPEKLKAINVAWNSDDISANNAMFGYFTKDVNTPTTTTETVDISPSNHQVHAWIRRAASKVTIAYDGSGLADGVEIYILAASIKDIPVKCPLGVSNKPDSKNLLIEQGGSILYYKNDVNDPNPNELTLAGYEAVVTNQSKTQKYGSDHSVSANALFFYENMQGKGKSKKQTAPGPGNNDGKTDNAIGFPNPDPNDTINGWKDNKPFGTYVEVDAYYRSTNPNKTGSGIIKYRFMLGKDTDKNYDAERNYHYKLTLMFKGYANDYDWHIEYDEGQAFDVTDPKIYNYTGTVFMPNYAWPNGKHKFVPENTVTVTSYVGNVNDPSIGFHPVDVEMEFDDPDSEWLEYTVETGMVPYQRNYVFTVKPESLNDPKYKKTFNLDAKLAEKTEVGSSDDPVNLADINRKRISENANITCTANCYMVNGPGWYILPLVYGNAIHNGAVVESTYKPYSSTSDETILPTFKNYRNQDISNAYIERDLNINTNNSSPFLIWDDVNELIEYSCWSAPGTDIRYVPDAFYDDENKDEKTIGGIIFHVAKGQQGNAVIAIGGKPTGTPCLIIHRNLPDVYWSWHIWETCLDEQLDAEDRTIEVEGHDDNAYFDFMPVNLGWCSDPDENIIYYKERRCTVRFTFKNNKNETITEEREIVKKSHIALTRGYSPYYQWGRKDPFPSAWAPMNTSVDQNEFDFNKMIYMSKDWGYHQNPQPLTTFVANDGVEHPGLLANRLNTRDALGEMIKYPYAWHNPPRKIGPSGGIYDFVSTNETFNNLWEGRFGDDPNAPIQKTVYDPCPVGYQVPHVNAFSGFTTTGKDSSNEAEWYDVRPENILNYSSDGFKGGPYYYESYEFYTSPEKTQSIIFPISGYRDWDGNGSVYQYGWIGYAWAAGNSAQDNNHFYNFEFARDDHNGDDERDHSYIRPRNTFYSCDGFPVRPVAYGVHGTQSSKQGKQHQKSVLSKSSRTHRPGK